jgi:hypothetical protein
VKPAAAIDPNTMFLAKSKSRQKHPVLAGSRRLVSAVEEIAETGRDTHSAIPPARGIVAEGFEGVNFGKLCIY